jgi:hypothetical protein
VAAPTVLLLAATLVLGCLYPGMATTSVTYYDARGNVVAVVEHATSWRQATVTVPLYAPAGEAHSEEYAMALADAQKGVVDHKAMSGEGGLAGAIGAVLGFFGGFGLGAL